MGGGGYKFLGGMDPDTFAPSDVIHLFVMEIDLDLSVGVPGGAVALDDDEEVGEFSDEELCDLPEGDDEEEPIVIDNVNGTIVKLAALEDTEGIAEGATSDHVAERVEDASEGAAPDRVDGQQMTLLLKVAADVAKGGAVVAAQNSEPGAAKRSKPPRQQRSHELLFKLQCIAKLEAGKSKRKILKDHSLEKTWVAQKQDLLKMARDVVQYGRRIEDHCRLGPCGFGTKYIMLDEPTLKWWRTTKTEQKQRVFRPRLQREIEKQAAHLGVPHSFNAVDWMQRFLKRHRIGDMAEKRRGTKSSDQLKQEVQKVHNICHSVCAAPALNVAP